MPERDAPLTVEYVVDDYAVSHLDDVAVVCEMVEGDEFSGVMEFFKDTDQGRMFTLTEPTDPSRIIVRTWIGNVRKITVL